jgi:hypothetical protein
MALASVMLRLGPLGLPIATAGITSGRVLFLEFEVPSPAGHGGETPDDQHDRQQTENQDVEHRLI